MRTEEAIDHFKYTRRARRLSPNMLSGYKYTLAKLEAMYPELPQSENDI